MTKWILRKMKTVIGVRSGISNRLWLCVLIGLVLAIACVCISLVSRSDEKAIPKKVRVYPQQEVVVKNCEAMLMHRIEEAGSFWGDWPEKDKYIAGAKKRSETLEVLEYTIGPVETLEWETIDEADLVAVSKPSLIIRNRSTGKITTLPKRGKNIESIVRKQKTTDGPHWFIVTEPRQFRPLAMSWLHQPRKKVADSATIVLKKAVMVQVVSDSNVVSERTVFWDEDVGSAIRQKGLVLLPPHDIAVKSGTHFLMDSIEESFALYADRPAEANGPGKEEAIEAAKDIRRRVQQLEWKLGPVEVRENETFRQATRVVVPVLSVIAEEVYTRNAEVVSDVADLVLEKHETAEGQQWRIIGSMDPRYSEIKSMWLDLPRKKVPGSPTIILKRAIVIQICSDGEVVSERKVFYDE
jgi:hypothetical protein